MPPLSFLSFFLFVVIPTVLSAPVDLADLAVRKCCPPEQKRCCTECYDHCRENLFLDREKTEEELKEDKKIEEYCVMSRDLFDEFDY
ncbi:hypothetical protein PRIPAC_97355 [Pristionchus pacificus]|uniref:Uncharacterized protein n=1 Tax=Pristionchus pacificus TaxID=54126 RepID=A0A2A6CH66_PRIPA|nr:hypothetical protein PRIPAC_97355 [Pristionchus pacificus]|eukprot:PDM77418.1 hypothetical protein PRIPAC_33148 [Pristionchus pacificus]